MINKKSVIYISILLLVIVPIIALVSRSLAAPVEGEVKTITLDSGNYNNPGSWKVNKSAKWIGRDKAQIEFDVETIAKNIDGRHKDIILVMDVSGSMEGEKLDRAKEDAIGLAESVLSDPNNRMALIIFDDESEIKTGLTNNRSEMINLLNRISADGMTNYNDALEDAETVLENYHREANRDLIILFLTDGYPNVNIPNQVATYQLLKDRFPYMTIHGIQYEMGEDIIQEIKDISDKQWLADIDTLNNVLFDAAFKSYKYENFVVTDYINNDYYHLDTVKDIKTNTGEVTLTEENGTQKITWNVGEIASGFHGKMTIDVVLKDEVKNTIGLFPTNQGESIESKLETEDNQVSITSEQTPKLQNGYKVTYVPNPPRGCNLGSSTVETHYAYEVVNKWTNKLTCEGYAFKGWEIISDDKLGTRMINDDTFIMPAYDVEIRGVWTRQDITKSMNGVVHENENTLYRVLQDAAIEGRYAKEFTGEHQDSFADNGIKSIYHWYADNDTDGEAILNKYNVRFANHCWIMLRTADTGGVRLLYNGEYDDVKKCGDDRSRKTYGSYGRSSISYSFSSYVYGTDYTFDPVTNKFTVTGNLTNGPVTYDTFNDFVGKYTCANGTDTVCSQIYKISNRYGEDTMATVYLGSYLGGDYSSIGSLEYNYGVGGLASAGYMYGDAYPVNIINVQKVHNFKDDYDSIMIAYKRNKFKGYVIDNPPVVESDPNGGHPGHPDYVFENATYVYNPSVTMTLKGKYYNGSKSSTAMPSYIVDEDSNYIYVIQLDYDEPFYTYENIYYGTEITMNDDGSYTIIDANSVTPASFYSGYTSYRNKIVCFNNSDTCNHPKKINSISRTSYTNYIYLNYGWQDANTELVIAKSRNGLQLVDTLMVNKYDYLSNFNNYSDYKYTCGNNRSVCTNDNITLIGQADTGFEYLRGVENKYYFGSDVTWDGEKFTLVDPKEFDIYLDRDQFNSHHYFCLNKLTTSCKEVAYGVSGSVHSSGVDLRYITLKNGLKDIDVIRDSQIKQNINESTVKVAIEEWYSRYMLDYSEYIEDNVYCNNRVPEEVNNSSYFNTKGDYSLRLLTNYDYSSNDYKVTSLRCSAITDKFSIYNDQAKLKYPVSLPLIQEFILFNNYKARTLKNSITTGTTAIYGYSGSPYIATYYGSSYTSSGYAISPVISVKYGTQYVSGDGSKDNPYYVETSEVNNNG